ncbi:hypothetical protein A0J61_08054 [Choanephora cucurbitarum]|uniref:Uncharacterized protein n=1 Tax=Choanephora cucurbitarum TaxID=101091 RepID=A0A1C7N972_9FUNG|nr:hypothetical protein A0J61_08054 [Choanephora cucurbitarum]
MKDCLAIWTCRVAFQRKRSILVDVRDNYVKVYVSLSVFLPILGAPYEITICSPKAGITKEEDSSLAITYNI